MPFPSLFRRIICRRGGGVWCLVLIPLSVLVAHRSFVEYQQPASSVRGGHQDATTTSAKPSSAATSSTATMLSDQAVNHSTALHARSAVAPPPKARHFLNNSDSSSTVQKHIQHMQNQNVHYAVTIPMVVQMSGEFGNHLSKLASALAVEYELHQRSSQSEPERWQAARNDGTSRVAVATSSGHGKGRTGRGNAKRVLFDARTGHWHQSFHGGITHHE
jgi:hypothetical protein